jgi:hypothetical protein
MALNDGLFSVKRVTRALRPPEGNWGNRTQVSGQAPQAARAGRRRPGKRPLGWQAPAHGCTTAPPPLPRHLRLPGLPHAHAYPNPAHRREGAATGGAHSKLRQSLPLGGLLPIARGRDISLPYSRSYLQVFPTNNLNMKVPIAFVDNHPFLFKV